MGGWLPLRLMASQCQVFLFGGHGYGGLPLAGEGLGQNQAIAELDICLARGRSGRWMMEATCEHGTTPSCGAYMKRRAHAHETTMDGRPNIDMTA
jgi:hypothetical protein